MVYIYARVTERGRRSELGHNKNRDLGLLPVTSHLLNRLALQAPHVMCKTLSYVHVLALGEHIIYIYMPWPSKCGEWVLLWFGSSQLSTASKARVQKCDPDTLRRRHTIKWWYFFREMPGKSGRRIGITKAEVHFGNFSSCLFSFTCVRATINFTYYFIRLIKQTLYTVYYLVHI